MRPKMYYLELLDCSNEVNRAFKSGQSARLQHTIILRTNNGNNEFSYEDVGLLSLYGMLFVLLGGLAVAMVFSFYKFWLLEGKWLAPHPISVYALWF